jgi:6-phosphofructokinase 2
MTQTDAHIVTLTLNPAVDISTSVGTIAPFSKLRCEAARRDPGGGGINVARVVHRLGRKVLAVYLAGGHTGESLHALVSREGIESHVIPIVAETREDFTVFEKETGRQYRFVLPGPPVDAASWQSCLHLFESFAVPPHMVVASGSLPPGVPSDFYARLARLLRNKNIRFILDTSGLALKAAVDEGLYMIKPNLHEMRDLTGNALENDDALVAAARRLVEERNIEIIALTLAERGAVLVTREGAWRAEPPAVKPLSTVGAGDSFLGVMAASFDAGMDLPVCFRRAVAAGTAALLAPGTELAVPADVDRLVSQTKITRL